MSARARALRAGAATGVGSLPHRDAAAAAALSLSAHSQLPAVPELPNLDPIEGMIGRVLDGSAADAAGVRAFLDAAKAAPPPAIKVQVAGPLTVGMALLERGSHPMAAFEAGADVSAEAAGALLGLLAEALPHSEPVLFVDEPALTAWRDDDPPCEREVAVDLLSATLSHIDAVTGVHVCGDGDRRMAIEAGPDVVGFPLVPSVLEDGVALGRFLDAGGWIAWGVIPTDRPIGVRPDHWWNELVALWCDLTRAGCDPVALRTQALITPACGLAGHSEEQAASILEQCVEVGERVREQAVATRLSVGA